MSTPLSRARDVSAVLLVSLYVLPLLWWGLSAFTPSDALLDISRMLRFDFSPTLANFALTILGVEGTIFDSRQSLIDSTLVALLATVIVLAAALPLAYALSQMQFRWQKAVQRAVILQRFMPPIAIIFPLVSLYHTAGLLDTRLGVALAHAAINLPFAALLLKILL
jgi:multiple sugar transport system permease protein